MKYLIVISILIISLSYVKSFEKEITVSIPAGRMECFFQRGKVGEFIDIDYQVIDGGHGDLDINFELSDPHGRRIFADYKKSDNLHNHEIQVDGDYRFCFDNRISKINQKIVFFELVVENKNEENHDEGDNDKKLFDGLTPDEFVDVKIQDIQESIGKIRTGLTRIRQLQEYIKSNEARDRNKAEENFYRVNVWSFFQIFLMIVVGSIQIFMLRGLFETTNTKAKRIWNKFS